MTQPEAPVPRRRALGRRIVGALLALELAYVGGFEWAARTGRLERWIDRRPDERRITFAAAHSIVPFWAWFRGVEATGGTPRADWRLTCERASGILWPLGLPARRARLLRARASGVTLQIRRRLEPAAPAAAPDPERERALPAFAALAAASAPRPRSPRPWSMEIPAYVAERVTDVWLDEFRLAGSLRARGGLALEREAELEIRPTRLELDDASLSIFGEPVGHGLRGVFEGRIAAHPFRETRGLDRLPHVHGTADLEGTVSEDRLLRRYLRRASWIGFDGAPSRLTAHLEIEGGELRPGSRVDFERGRRTTRIFHLATTGDAVLRFAVTRDDAGPRADLSLRYDDYELVRGEAPRPDIVGTGLSFVATTRDLRPRALPEDLTVAFDLGEARMPDLSAFADLVPPAAKLELVSGSGRVEGRVEAKPADGSASGGFRTTLADARVRYGDVALAGEVEVAIAVAGADLERRRLDLSGSRFELRDFRAAAADRAAADGAAGAADGWWTRVELPRATLSLPPEPGLDASFVVALRDSIPLIGFYAERRDLPKWVQRFFTVHDLRGEGRFVARPGELTLEEFSTRFRRTAILARLRLGREERIGVMMLRWRRLALGLRVEGREKDLKFLRVAKWYDAQRL